METQGNTVEAVLSNLQIKALNEMQLASLEANKNGSDVLLLSPTGSGKTLGFLLPLLLKLDANVAGVQALILAPSRELALQIESVFKSMKTGFKVTCCYGGHDSRTEINNLQNPPAVLIGTPGRIADHVKRESFNPTTIKTLILDEFDKSLEMGFGEDMAFIISGLKELKHRILTSATQAVEIPDYAGVKKPVVINYLKDAPALKLYLKCLYATENDKFDALIKLLNTFENQPTLVFCNHREAVDRISELLRKNAIVHDVFHGGMEQIDRERALIKYRNGSSSLLITTDLASRGLDIPEIKHVVHYQLPPTEEAFIHRNGRTARMHASGSAYLVLAETETIPKYIAIKPEKITVADTPIVAKSPEWITLCISTGKRDKISKVDIVGLFLQKGKLDKADLGLIEIKDKFSYVAIKRSTVKRVLESLKDERIKKVKVTIELAR